MLFRGIRSTIIFILILPFTGTKAQTWKEVKELPSQKRRAARSFTIDGKGYVIGGVTSSGPSDELWQYDPATNTWSQKADFPGNPRRSPVAFSIGKKGYYGTGSSTYGVHRDLWEYDPKTDSWTQKSSIPSWAPAREMATAWALNGKGYIGMGRANSYTFYSDVLRYDPSSDSWKQVSAFPGQNPGSAVAFVIDSFAYVGTGGVSGHSGSDAFFRYDPVKDDWSSIPDLPGPGRRNATSFSIQGKGYVGLGWNGDTYYKDAYVYHPSKNAWKAVPDLPAKRRRNATGFSLKGEGYAACGRKNGSNVATDEVWKFIPESDPPPEAEDSSATQAQLGLSVHPVPVRPQTYVRIEVEGKRKEALQLRLHGARAGTSKARMKIPKDQKRLRYKLPDLEQGVYTLSLWGSNGIRASEKFIVTE